MFLELDKAQLSQFRVSAPGVSEALDVIEHVHLSVIPRPIALASGVLGIERREEALHRGVVPDISRSAH